MRHPASALARSTARRASWVIASCESWRAAIIAANASIASSSRKGSRTECGVGGGCSSGSLHTLCSLRLEAGRRGGELREARRRERETK
eukprot:scaffold130582_cov30-Tisochrysis_lutea.AAC.2